MLKTRRGGSQTSVPALRAAGRERERENCSFSVSRARGSGQQAGLAAPLSPSRFAAPDPPRAGPGPPPAVNRTQRGPFRSGAGLGALPSLGRGAPAHRPGGAHGGRPVRSGRSLRHLTALRAARAVRLARRVPELRRVGAPPQRLRATAPTTRAVGTRSALLGAGCVPAEGVVRDQAAWRKPQTWAQRESARTAAAAGFSSGRSWGDRGDLNPRPPGPQPGALTRLSYGHHGRPRPGGTRGR